MKNYRGHLQPLKEQVKISEIDHKYNPCADLGGGVHGGPDPLPLSKLKLLKFTL